MGHKVSPISLRLGITEDWRSRWYADKKKFGEYLVEDQKIRKFIKRNYFYAGISKIEIERTRDTLLVILHVARPGLVIGRRGVEIERLTNNVNELTGGEVEISVREVDRPELTAQLVAEEVSQAIERRTAFRRAMGRAAEMSMEAGAGGIKIVLAGRLGGSEMARREKVLLGRIPLHTFSAHIDYGFTEAHSKYGNIGVKVWINRPAPAPTVSAKEESDNAPDAQES